MTQEFTPTPKKYASENWWHRLLRVLLMYFPTVAIFGFLALLGWENARYYTYSYSFEKDYSKKEGVESPCSVLEYSKWVSCGGLQNPDVFMTNWLAVRGFDKT